jgi:hypothetical protein
MGTQTPPVCFSATDVAIPFRKCRHIRGYEILLGSFPRLHSQSLVCRGLLKCRHSMAEAALLEMKVANEFANFLRGSSSKCLLRARLFSYRRPSSPQGRHAMDDCVLIEGQQMNLGASDNSVDFYRTEASVCSNAFPHFMGDITVTVSAISTTSE